MLRACHTFQPSDELFSVQHFNTDQEMPASRGAIHITSLRACLLFLWIALKQQIQIRFSCLTSSGSGHSSNFLWRTTPSSLITILHCDFWDHSLCVLRALGLVLHSAVGKQFWDWMQSTTEFSTLFFPSGIISLDWAAIGVGSPAAAVGGGVKSLAPASRQAVWGGGKERGKDSSCGCEWEGESTWEGSVWIT